MTKNIYEKLSEERKQMQAEGVMPEWYTTGGWQMFKEKYLYEADNIKEQFERIAATAAKHLRSVGKEEEANDWFFKLLWEGWLSGSTPVLANTGTDRGLPISCSGSVIGDSIYEFYQARLEAAILTKYGFGTSAYFGNIRPRGALISTGGTASGAVEVWSGFIDDMAKVKQGSVRRGSFAAYFPITSKDFDEAADYTMAHTDDANIGWCVSNKFIDSLNALNSESVRRFQKTQKLKLVMGKGYYSFPDKINAKRPKMYVDHGLFVKASNLCVAPETKTLTDAGYITISEYVDQKVNVWNGYEYSEVTIKKTGENQELLKVITSSGQDLECTKYHKWYVSNDYTGKKVEKRTCELVPGDKLVKFSTPVVEGTEELPYAYDNGFYSADGCLIKGRAGIYTYGTKKALKPYLTSVENWNDDPSIDRSLGFSKDILKNKYFVPDSKFSIKSRLEWLAGLSDGDGTIARNGSNESLQITSIHKEFLKEIQLMLQTLGIHSKIALSIGAGMRMLPANDGSGENKGFECKDAYRLTISSYELFSLSELGFSTNRLKWEKRLPQRNAEQFNTIVEVIATGRKDDTYCFTEPKRHLGVFNGVLTGNCDEITLFADLLHTFTCVLSSMNVSKWHEWKDSKAVYWSTIFLDCIVSEFLERARKIPGLEKAVRFTEKGRALGLGQCGYHTLLQEMGLPWHDMRAHTLSQQIAKHIHDESLLASQDLAKWLGEPEWCKGYGVRNTHRTAIAPTKSTALLMGGVSEGINPDPAMVFNQGTSAGEVARITPVFLKVMKEAGHYNKATIKRILAKSGSVQGEDWLTPEQKEVFRTAFEINQLTVLSRASARGRYLCQWQSLNTFFSSDEDPAWIAHCHTVAFNDPDILGLYYITTQSGVMGSKECEACQ